MTSRRPIFVFLLCAISMFSSLGLFVPAPSALAAAPLVIDTFESPLPSGIVAGIPIGFNTFQDPNSSVAISTTPTPPAAVPGASNPNTVLKLDLNVVSYAGFTHSFESAALDQWVAQDWSAYEGLSFWLYGNNSGTTMFVDVLDNRNSPTKTNDDAERWTISFADNFSGWQEIKLPFAAMSRKEIGNGAPNDGFGLTEVHGWALGTITTPSAQSYYVDNVTLYGVAPIRPLTVGFSAIDYKVTEGTSATIIAKLSKPSSDPVTVNYATTIGGAIANRDYTPVAGTLTFPANTTQQSITVVTFDNAKYQGERGVQIELSNPTGGAALGLPPVARIDILDNETYDPVLLDDFESPPYLWSADGGIRLSNPEIAAGTALSLPGQGAYERVLQASKSGNGSLEFGRNFAIGQDWSDSSGLNFWYYGRNSGKRVGVALANNQATISDPAQWKLAWSDEFNGKRGAAPNPNVWGRELGDGVAIGNPGWGNDELEYYTNSTDNAATDGRGNLVITTKAADGSLQCYYGPCKYTSARLLTKNRFEVAYGRVEARIKVPRGAGLWPAFWMLGTDIDQVNWPQTGEIDIMENVGRLPNRVFGTLHGPGYAGGQSYGRFYDFATPVADDFHTFAVEWQPDKIVWYVDGIQYHQATPADAFLQGKQWVYNHSFFMLLNVAVGGNFGGAVGADTTFPQAMTVDYVRLYQTKPRPSSFKTSFRDNFNGWKQIQLPFTSFTGEDGQKLNLSAVQSINFEAPGDLRGQFLLDQVRLTCANSATVTSVADSGPGSLRKAIGSVCVGGTVRFAAALAGQTISLASGALTIGKNVTIDGADAPGLTISGGGTVRVIEMNAGTTATIRNLILTRGYGFQLAGGILNNGNLTLDHVTVTGNTMTTNGGQYWQGGGGIYNGDGATLNLVDSTVSNNNAGWSGGAIYSFFHTTTTIIRSTISGNITSDVGGGIRSLGDVVITNSTISGNTASGWHGGAIFHTDGNLTISSSTIANNIAPDWGSSTIFIGEYAPGVLPTLTLTNSIITGNQWYACEQYASGNPVVVNSGGNNLVQDGSCNPAASDIIASNANIGPLANNGGPTQTHALLPGSRAIDAAGSSPATDQRGVSRPAVGADIGSYEAP